MAEFSIRDKCSVNTNWDEDTFVGLKCKDGDFSVHFPLGFVIPGDDKELRRDIIVLLSVIGKTTARKESEIQNEARIYNCTEFPFQAYLSIIRDFYERGYFKEREIHFTVAKRGKIDWNRTIKTQKPYIQDNDSFYLDFVTRKNQVNENELISLIHEYCVYESFSKVGWLFTTTLPKKPRIKRNIRLFKSILITKISNTFNDRNRKLFQDMLAVILYNGEENSEKNYRYGTYRFEYVWEALINKVYGIKEKREYFPNTYWSIDGVQYENACLEPDTIMIWNGNVYVLDAKYYKYGVTRRMTDLPESTSINKQITYGEFIAEQECFKKKHGENYKVYNAFIMPYAQKNGEELKNIGIAYSNWKTNEKSYENIQGILLDIKHLMYASWGQNVEEIEKLVQCIEGGIKNAEN
ncbi:LlaJI family restriction endonuclease [[Ruminococcus] lactaris]|jgi:hypothetical protein|uniref:LlaJI family restriction endonuclease n=1 Tax=[Ruminococcus] lactaris TaxID=46228 RepID=A0A414P2P1_9FIRM|nr:LlaJI family restriction endonuclease [[Ruminococcus] lactaris]RHF58908.1 LlaJI family restriction endonuclease [[Ruminococcus] lactaris]DAG53791.1 MAG TPA: LlaJI restriction endonuclease [Bacteriophage sp.]